MFCMATRAQVPPSKPKYLLTASGARDFESTLIPSFYSENRKVPKLSQRPFTTGGAPGRTWPRSKAPPRPTTSQSQSIDFGASHLYVGRSAKTRQRTGEVDNQKLWLTTNKFPTRINVHADAASASWALLRPTVSKSLVQMGLCYTNRL
jgi:hypothetical protein